MTTAIKDLKVGLNFGSETLSVGRSNGAGGEQSTLVMGEGRNITGSHLVNLGLSAKLPKSFIEEVIQQTKSALTQWRSLSKAYGISTTNIELINKVINS